MRPPRRLPAFLMALAMAGATSPAVAQEPEISPSPQAAAATTSGSAPVTPAPSLIGDLPHRAMPDIPVFVGPASLKVSGKPGAYRWGDTHFGSQAVNVTVALVPGQDACALRLRVVEDGAGVADVWFSNRSGAKQMMVSGMDVDYAHGKLKVDSDCKSWSVRLAPLEDPDLELKIEEEYYPVRGDSIEELIDGTQHVEGVYAAYTEWYTRWESFADAGDGSCRITHGDVAVSVTLTYPNWKRPADAGSALVAEWQRFMEKLRIHEQGHVTIALQGADAIDDRLDQGFSGSNCKRAGKKADDRATRIFDRYGRASERYDQTTNHGLTQGTGLG